MLKKLTLVLLHCLPVLTAGSAFAQKEDHVWFAPYLSLDFNTSPAPQFIAPPAIPSNGQPAGICDSAGTLLFYTNGNVVYGKNHLPMPNGILANGAEERFDLHPCSALILPKGGSEYYLFSLLPDSISVDLPSSVSTQYMIHPSLYYSIIDMQLNGGNGDVVPGSKKILLQREMMRGFLAGAKGPGCDSAWIVVHAKDAASFLAYPVTPAGIGNAVSSLAGVNFLGDAQAGYGFHYGKFSPDGRRLALFSWRRSVSMPVDPGTYASLELIRFDAQTGVFSGAESLYENLDFSPFMYGCFPMSFSPDSKKFYSVQRSDYDVATWNKVLQYDLTPPTLPGILASELVVGTVPPLGQGSSPFMNDMRLAPDGKIYIACGDIFPLSSGGAIPLARINDPNASGAASGFESGLSSPLATPGNPMLFPVANMPRGGATTAANITQRLCAAGPLTIGSSKQGEYLWSTGSTDSSISVATPGTYWVHATNACVQHTDTFTILAPLDPDLLPGDTTVCRGTQWLLLLLPYPDVQYSWQNGLTGNSYLVDHEGTITVTAQTSCGLIRDSMKVTYGNCDCDLLFVPTAFTPNADGLNDVFRPRYPCSRSIQFYELKIYNRWGQVAFSSRVPEQGWDGTMGGGKADLGVYHYTLQVQTEGSTEELFKAGQLTLLR